MKQFIINKFKNKPETTSTARSRWLWFIGLYVISFIVVGGLMSLTHWFGDVLATIA